MVYLSPSWKASKKIKNNLFLYLPWKNWQIQDFHGRAG
jgi:hypothetical protein